MDTRLALSKEFYESMEGAIQSFIAQTQEAPAMTLAVCIASIFLVRPLLTQLDLLYKDSRISKHSIRFVPSWMPNRSHRESYVAICGDFG
jgi:hypothetical protein